MLLYILKRLLLMLPTMLAITLLAFGLSRFTPGDPVREQMELGDASISPAAYRLEYRLQAERLGYHLPAFYFGLSPRAFPDTLYRIVLPEHREWLRALVRQTGNWPATEALYQAVESGAEALAEAPGPPEAAAATRYHWQRLYLTTTAKALASRLDSVAAYLGRDSALQARVRPAFQRVEAAFQYWQDHPTRAESWWPDLKWYGAQNQYHRWLSNILGGDFGLSLRDQRPVTVRIGEAVRWTLRINGWAILFAYLLSIPIGVYAAAHVGRRFDRVTSTVLFLLYSLPSFWVASMLILFLTTPEWLDLFPSMGVGEVPTDASWWEGFQIRASHLFLPVFCLTYGSLAFISRQVRGAMVEVLEADYVRTARAKGLSPGRVLWRHAFRNGLFPLITMFAGVLPLALAGSVVIEVIFNIPGMGRLTVDAILAKDWPVVFGLLLLAGLLTLVGILLADLLYAWADPRVRLGKETSASR